MSSRNKKKKKRQTTKVLFTILMVFILANCLMIEFYSMYSMFVLGNLEALGTLISTAIGSCFALVLEFAIYCAKSFLETKAEKELEFRKEQFEVSQSEEEGGRTCSDDDEADFSGLEE